MGGIELGKVASSTYLALRDKEVSAMKSNESKTHKVDAGTAARKTWEPLKLAYVGDIREIIQGTSKTSVGPGDPGDPIRQPPGLTAP